MPRPQNRDSSLYYDYPNFAFARPPELDGRDGHCPVVVVGAGPVGLTAALELARHGVRTIVIDPKASVGEGSRAICVARHSLEILQQLKLAERFVDKGLGWTHGTSYYRGRPVYRLSMPHSDQERFFPMYNLQQQYIEEFLVEHARREPLVEVRWQSRFEGFDDAPDTRRLAISTPDGRYTLAADYVIAADGARSTVRDSLGLKLTGEAHEGRYVIVDVRMKSDYPTERRAFFGTAQAQGDTVLVHKQPDDIWRIDYQLPADADPHEAIGEERIRQTVGDIIEMLGEDAPWELEWWSIYQAYTLALENYAHRNVFFAGDAAHLVPIFGVRGLNSGFADAANIGWKLAYVIHGDASSDLLDSYSLERRGATLDIFANAARSTRFMTPPTRGMRLMRDAALELSISETFTQPLINPRQSLPYIYSMSPLTQFPERDREFDLGPSAGAALVNQRTGEDQFLLDYLGDGFNGIYFTGDGPPRDVGALRSALPLDPELFHLILIGAEGDVASAYCEHIARTYGAVAGTFYLVRPDRHVCARWRICVPEEVRIAIVNCLRGMSP